MRPDKLGPVDVPGRIRASAGGPGMDEGRKKPGEKEPSVDPDDRLLRGVVRMLPAALVLWTLLAALIYWLL